MSKLFDKQAQQIFDLFNRTIASHLAKKSHQLKFHLKTDAGEWYVDELSLILL